MRRLEPRVTKPLALRLRVVSRKVMFPTITSRTTLQLSLEHAGRVMLDLIPKIYDSERVVRLMGDDDTHSYTSINETVIGFDGQPMLVNNLAQAKFDIRVDIGPSYTTQRIEAATSMLDYAKSDPTAMPVMRDIFVRNMDWPGADQLADRLKKNNPAAISERQRTGSRTATDRPSAAAANQLQFGGPSQVAKATADAQRAQAEVEKTVVATQARKIETQIAIAQANKRQAVTATRALSAKDLTWTRSRSISGHPQPTASRITVGLAKVWLLSDSPSRLRTSRRSKPSLRRRRRRRKPRKLSLCKGNDWRQLSLRRRMLCCRCSKHGHGGRDDEPAAKISLERGSVGRTGPTPYR